MTLQSSSRLIVVVGPSGAGKDTVLRLWRERLPAGAPVHFVRRIAPALRVVEITAPPEVLAQRLRERSHEQGAALDERLARAALPVQADLTLVNDGQASSCAQALDFWWQGLREGRT